ncbi:hypothetical protein GCM10010156_26780 [Planobispora rosea]|uniref:Uncharacterized protein n=1 Tax=Planobispora rosea TaxID=35762 RepID=A0A8J3WD82_PLARO|nr:hypothetical protein GCM10010156_26780 [Planobispora rosea]GIH85040.1 hypothetical protein Pro02_34480 [Planobispora rosea]
MLIGLETAERALPFADVLNLDIGRGLLSTIFRKASEGFPGRTEEGTRVHRERARDRGGEGTQVLCQLSYGAAAAPAGLEPATTPSTVEVSLACAPGAF